MSDHYDDVQPHIEHVASRLSTQFPELEFEDITQEGWLYVYSSPEEVTKYLSGTPEGAKYLRYRIRRAMLKWCNHEMRVRTGTDWRDALEYTPGMIKELLPHVFFPEDWQSFSSSFDDMPKRKRQVNETGNRQAMLADVSRMLPALTDDQYNAVVWRYKYGLTFDQLGKELGISRSSASDRVTRAVNRMALILSGSDPGEKDDDPPREYTGGRRAMTNAHARACQENYY